MHELEYRIGLGKLSFQTENCQNISNKRTEQLIHPSILRGFSGEKISIKVSPEVYERGTIFYRRYMKGSERGTFSIKYGI